MKKNILKGRNAAILKAVMNAIIPRGGAFGPGAADYDLLPRVEAIVRSYDPSIRSLFPLMLSYIQFTALLRRGRVFTRLREDRAIAFLHGMETSPFFYRRIIILLMKLVTMLAFYEDDAVSRFTGYVHGCDEGR